MSLSEAMASTDIVSFFKAIYGGDLDAVKQAVQDGTDLSDTQFVIRKYFITTIYIALYIQL